MAASDSYDGYDDEHIIQQEFGNEFYDENGSLNDTTINSTGNATAGDYDDVMSNPILRVVFVSLYAVIFILGVSGNSLVVLVVWRNKSLQTITNIFIANLAASDVMMCLLAVPFTPISGLISDWIFGKVLCHIVPMIMGVSIYVSTLTSMAVAVDRYVAIVHPFRARMTAGCCLLVIVGVWAASVTVTLPLAIHQNVSFDNETGERVCTEDWLQPGIRRTFTFGSLILQYVAPCVIISVCYWRVSVALRRRARAKKGLTGSGKGASAAARSVTVALTTGDERTKASPGPAASTVTVSRRDQLEIRRNRRTNRMLIASVAIFVCCWLPLNVINLVIEYYGIEIFGPYYVLTFFIFHVFAMSSTIYNPFLYGWMNDSFRTEFIRALPHFLIVAFGCSGGEDGDTMKETTRAGSRRGHNGVATAASRRNDQEASKPVASENTRKPTMFVSGAGAGGGGETANEVRRSASRAGGGAPFTAGAVAAVGANDVAEPDEAAKLMSATDDDVTVMTSTTQF